MDEQQKYSMGDHARLAEMLELFFRDSTCEEELDEEAIRVLSDELGHFLLSDKTFEGTPDVLLPKAAYGVGFDIWDEESKEHVVRMTLKREGFMTTGDFLKMQNFFWTTVGKAIRNSPAIIDILRGGGVIVETDFTDEGEGGQQASPA